MSRTQWRITVLALALAGFLGATVEIIQKGGDLVAAYRGLQAQVCRPTCDLTSVDIQPNSISFPGGLDGLIQIHKDKSRYGVYFLGRLKEEITTDMRRGGIKDRYEPEFVDFACGHNHELSKASFSTPSERGTYTLWIDFYQDDTPGQFQTPGPIDVVIPAATSRPPTSADLNLHGYPASMRASWQCRVGIDGPCWMLPLILALVLGALCFAAYKGWSPPATNNE